MAKLAGLAKLLAEARWGWLADHLARRSPRALFLVPGLALIAAAPFTLLAIYGQSKTVIYAGIFLSEALMFINTGPCNAVIANVVMPNMRAAAYAMIQKGVLVTISRKVIINDDVGAVQRLVTGLGVAARRTLARAVFAPWVANSNAPGWPRMNDDV